MGHESGIITAPIGYEPDIYKTLGIGKTSRGYDIIYACANTHGKINMWAKFKPTRAGGTPVTPAEWWKGPDGRCGLGIPVYSTPGNLNSGFVHDMISGAARWTYEAPRPGIDHCRATDFKGYNHNAGNPFGTLEGGFHTLNSSGEVTVRVLPNNLQAQGQLTEKDIALPDGLKLTEMRLGVVFWNDDSYAIRSDITAQGSTSLTTATLRNMAVLNGTWNALPILCSDLIDGTVGIVGKYLATGNNEVVKMSFSRWSEMHTITVSGTKVKGQRTVKADVVFDNLHPTDSFTFRDITIVVATKNATTGAMGVVGRTTMTDITLAAGGTAYRSVQINIILAIGEEPTLYIAGSATNVSPHYTVVSVTNPNPEPTV